MTFLKIFGQICGRNILLSYLTSKFSRLRPSPPVEVSLCTVDARTKSHPPPLARRRFLPLRPLRWRVSACSLERAACTWRLQLGSQYATPPTPRSSTSYPPPGLALRGKGNSKAFHDGLRLYVSQERKHQGMKILQKSFLSTRTVRHFQNRHICCLYTRYPVLSVAK